MLSLQASQQKFQTTNEQPNQPTLQQVIHQRRQMLDKRTQQWYLNPFSSTAFERFNQNTNQQTSQQTTQQSNQLTTRLSPDQILMKIQESLLQTNPQMRYLFSTPDDFYQESWQVMYQEQSQQKNQQLSKK